MLTRLAEHLDAHGVITLAAGADADVGDDAGDEDTEYDSEAVEG
ncbi:hypothetical protein [Streptomyces sp. NPDC048611]